MWTPENSSKDRRGPLSRTDAFIAVLLFAAAVGYLALLPRNLNPADEANYLNDAKRLYSGAVTYRDYFTVITPGSLYFMAALFRVLGPSIDTARMAAAGLHGAMAVLAYLTCRRLGVRREWSLLPAVAQLVVAEPAWPIASQHWLSTFLCVLLLFVCAGRRRWDHRWPLRPGIVLGLLIGVQQQRGVFMAAGIFAWLVIDAVLQRRAGHRPTMASLATQLVWLVAGTLAVMLPLGIHMIVSAGFDPVWQALVVFPLSNYRSVTRCEWGHMNLLTAWQGSFTFPSLLKYLPVILVLSLARLMVQWLRRDRSEEIATLTLLVVFCLASVLSIAYFPDFVHIAFIAPAFFVTAAENVEWGTRRLPLSPSLLQTMGGIAVIGLFIAGGTRLYQLRVRLLSEFPLSRMTAFGRIDFRKASEVSIFDQLRALLQQQPSRYLFVYPGASHLYLMLDVENATPWGFYSAAFHGPERFQQTLQELTTKQPRYIVILAFLVPPDDPFVAWVRQRYDLVGDDGTKQQLIYRIR